MTTALEQARAWTSYTTADHARVAYAHAAWMLVGTAADGVAPQWWSVTGPERSATMQHALSVAHASELLLRRAAFVCREDAMSWTEIGELVGGITKQAAQVRYGKAHDEFRRRLEAITAAVDGPDAISVEDALMRHDPADPDSYLVNTCWYAPQLDYRLHELGAVQGVLPFQPPLGTLLLQLSTGTGPANATVEPARCRHTADVAGPGYGKGSYLRCTLPEDHPPSQRHKMGLVHE